MPRCGALMVGMMAVAWAASADEAPAPTKPDPIAPLPLVQSYDPIYLLFGGNPAIAKFQVSLKTRLFNPTWGTPLDGRVGDGLYFGYSQTTFWDLEAESRPFDNSSYRPEFFWLQDNLQPDWLTARGELWWQAGLRHESNGQADPDSRSFNQIYLRPSLTLRWDRRRFVTVRPSAWIYVGDLSDNPDIAQYRGYADIWVTGGKEDGLQAAVLARVASGLDRGYIQLDITFPLSRATSGYFRPLLHLQGSMGYADSLDDYRQREDRVLAGFSFVR